MNWAQCSDEQLLQHTDDADCMAELLRRYTRMCHAVAADFAALPHEDCVQECGIALLEAARHYDPTRGASFGTYAWVCMRNRLCRMARTMRAQRQRPATGQEAAEGVEAEVDWLEAQQELRHSRAEVRHRLSEMEYRVYVLYTAGNRQNEIAALLSTPEHPVGVKSINNALQRIRRKLRRQTRGEE